MFAGPLARAVEFPFTISELGELRTLVRGAAVEAQLDAEKTEDLALAVNELATNSICHAGGGGSLRIWREEQTVVCEVRDRGHLAEPWTRRSHPGHDAITGRGLWLVEQLCDLVQVHSSPGSGSSVRIHMGPAGSAAR